MAKKDKRFYIPDFYNKNRRFLENFCMNLYEYNGLPDTIDSNYLEMLLQKQGYAVGTKYKDDIIVISGALSGLDYQNKPTTFISTNSVIPTFKRTVGVDCIPCYNTWNWYQIQSNDELIHVYATKLAHLDISMQTSLYNTRCSFVFPVSSDADANRARLMYDDIADGKPAILQYKSNAWTNDDTMIIPLKARDNLIISELSDARRCIIADFLTEIGVNCIAVDKAERTNLYEMQSNKQQLIISSAIGLEPRKKWCKAMNEMFGLNITVKLRGDNINDIIQGETFSEKLPINKDIKA